MTTTSAPIEWAWPSMVSSTHSITRTTSLGSCDSMISSGGWDLVIYAVQNWSHESYALNSYVASGGMAIMQDWTSNNGRASAFGIKYGVHPTTRP